MFCGASRNQLRVKVQEAVSNPLSVQSAVNLHYRGCGMTALSHRKEASNELHMPSPRSGNKTVEYHVPSHISCVSDKFNSRISSSFFPILSLFLIAPAMWLWGLFFHLTYNYQELRRVLSILSEGYSGYFHGYLTKLYCFPVLKEG